jgi:hypothetical protein
MARLRKFFWLGLLLALAGCRQDMHDQPRFKPLAQSDFYADLRSARAPVEGTVARGQLHEDTYFTPVRWAPTPATICHLR